jgi:hypothetical protein
LVRLDRLDRLNGLGKRRIDRFAARSRNASSSRSGTGCPYGVDPSRPSGKNQQHACRHRSTGRRPGTSLGQ